MHSSAPDYPVPSAPPCRLANAEVSQHGCAAMFRHCPLGSLHCHACTVIHLTAALRRLPGCHCVIRFRMASSVFHGQCSSEWAPSTTMSASRLRPLCFRGPPLALAGPYRAWHRPRDASVCSSQTRRGPRPAMFFCIACCYWKVAVLPNSFAMGPQHCEG